jgi:hypothetical protein
LKVDGNGQLGWATDSTTDSTKLPLAGGTLTGTLTSNSNINTTGAIAARDITLTDTDPGIIFTDSDGNPDYQIVVNAGHFMIKDATASADRLYINASSTTITNNLNVNSGVDITGMLHVYKTGTNTKLLLSRNESVGTDNTAIGVIDFANNTAHTVNARIMAKTSGTGNVGGQLVIETRDPSNSTLDERLRITSGGSVNIGGDYTQTTTKVQITGTTGLNGIQLSQNGSTTQNLKLKGLNTQSSNDVGISLYNNSNNWCCQLYGTNGGTAYYGFLDGNWNQWDIKKQANGAFEVDEGSGLQRVLTAGNIGSGGALSNVTPYVNQLRIGANSTTASTAGDDLVIEGASDRGLSIISGSGSSANIYFGDSNDADVGRIAYQHNDNALDFSVNARTTALRIDQGGVQNYTGSSADNRYANVQVRHKTPYSTDGSYPGGSQTSTNQTVFSLYNESHGGNKMAFRSSQGHQFEIETKTRDLGSGSYNDADVYFRGQYDGALSDRYIIDAYGGHTFKDRSGNTGLHVNSNGYVTKPQQPNFLTYSVNSDGSANSNNFLNIGNAYINIGSDYNTSNGRFTCPTTGVYFFYCCWTADSSTNSPVIYFWVNGSQSQNGALNYNSQYAGTYLGQCFSLNANDYVQCSMRDWNNSAPSPWQTWWGGYLLQ